MSRTKDQSGSKVRLFVTAAGEGQAFLTASVVAPCPPEQAAAEAYGRIGAHLAREGMGIVHERAYGCLSAHEAVASARAEALAGAGLDADTALTYIQGCPLWGEGWAGVNLQAVRAGGVRTVRDGDGRAAGRSWRRHGATYLLLQNLQGGDGERTTQADRMFDRAQRLLAGQGVEYLSVARTWIYLSDILSWYGQFNPVRTRWYNAFGLLPGSASGNGSPLLLPASTGIEGDVPTRAAVAMDLLAVVGGEGCPVTVEQMSNRRQKDAFRYGSSFSRGACIREPDNMQFLVSGTAAIDERGQSILPGDAPGQIGATFDIVNDLVAQRGAALRNVCDANFFVKRPQDADALAAVVAERGLGDIPAVCMVADVCRDELLFEMDGRAVLPA